MNITRENLLKIQDRIKTATTKGVNGEIQKKFYLHELAALKKYFVNQYHASKEDHDRFTELYKEYYRCYVEFQNEVVFD